MLRPEVLRKRKDAAALAGELAAGPAGPDAADWLWLYVKAEQVRYAIGELLGYLSIEEVEASLSLLADAVLTHLLRRLDPRRRLLLVALGKYGGAELTFGSDLDLLFVAREADAGRAAAVVRSCAGAAPRRTPRRDVRGRPAPAAARRCRPAGHHAGRAARLPRRRLGPGLGAPAAHARAGRRRRPGLAAEFTAIVDDLLIARRCRPRRPPPCGPCGAGSSGSATRRFRRNAPSRPARAAWWTSSFWCNCSSCATAADSPAIRRPGTRAGLRALAAAGLIPAEAARQLLANYDFLKRIEILLRGDANRAVSVLGATPEERAPAGPLAGFPAEAEFWAEHCRRLAETRRLVLSLLPPGAVFTATALKPAGFVL